MIIDYVESNVNVNVQTLTFFTEPKVCYLHKTLCVKQQVVQFKIPDNQNRNYAKY